MIGHVGACEVQIAGQLCRVGRPVEQRQDDPGPGRVDQRAAQPVHHVQARSNGQHALNYTARTEVVLRNPESLSVRTRLCQLGIDPRDDSPDHQGTHEAATEPRHITAKATLSRIASFTAGLLGLLLSAVALGVILYSAVSAPGASSEQALAGLLVAFLLCGELALLTVIDLKPILSSDGRSGARSAMLRMQMSSTILAGSVATAIMLVSTNASLGNFLPAPRALTAAGAILRWSMVYRRRVDAVQREIAERLTDVVIVASRPESTIALTEALMRLENTISPASEEGRLGA